MPWGIFCLLHPGHGETHFAQQRISRRPLAAPAYVLYAGVLLCGIAETLFCRAFVNDKVKYNRWGRRKIEQALWQKHVPSEVSSPILNAVPDADYIEALSSLLNAKWHTIKANTDYERSMKFIKYALGRGFDMDIIRQCINEMTNEAVLEDES